MLKPEEIDRVSTLCDDLDRAKFDKNPIFPKVINVALQTNIDYLFVL